MSKNSEWQKTKKAKGICTKCIRKRVTASHCQFHHQQHLQEERNRKGHEAWRPGGKGRPPKYIFEEESCVE